MKNWQNIRFSFLATTLFGILLVLTKVILFPASSSQRVSTFIFPSVVPLTSWQFLSSHSLVTQPAQHSNALSGRHYRFIQNGLPLDIEIYYLVNTVGDVKELLETYKSVPISQLTLRQQPEVGFYSLFMSQGNAYLSTCINPRGGSTVTDRQFKQNRNAYDVQLKHIIPWLLGQANLKDNRCLWTQLFISLNSTSLDQAYQIIETAFSSWYRWWYPRFPK